MVLTDFDIGWWRNSKIGFCLSSGYFGFFAHLGFIRAMEELGIRPLIVAGSSSGALVGAMYCGGLTSKEIEQRLLSIKIFTLFVKPFQNLKLLFNLINNKELINKFDLLFSKEKFYNLLLEALPVKRFEDLKIPLVVNSYNLTERKTVYIKEGDLALGVMLSTLHPLLFSPYYKDGALFLDGGIKDKVPLTPLLEENLDGVMVSYLQSHFLGGNFILFKERLEKHRLEIKKLREKGIKVKVVSPRIESCGILKYHKGEKLAQESYKDVIQRIKDHRFGCRQLW